MPVLGIHVASEEHFGLPIIAFANGASLEGWLGAQPADSKWPWIKFAKSGQRASHPPTTPAASSPSDHARPLSSDLRHTNGTLRPLPRTSLGNP
jgi:hypothetical protein